MVTKFGGNQGTVIVGTQRADYLDGQGGNDIIKGLYGTDRLFGGTGNDTVHGGNGDDTLHGNTGKDRLLGGDDNDVLNGGGGNDQLLGGRGKDILIGGQGDDVLRGDLNNGAYQDIFVFGAGSGKDVVMDFDVDRDILQISKGLGKVEIDSALDVLKNAKQIKGDVIIDLGDGNTITLKDVSLTDLKKNPSDHFDIV